MVDGKCVCFGSYNAKVSRGREYLLCIEDQEALGFGKNTVEKNPKAQSFLEYLFIGPQ